VLFFAFRSARKATAYQRVPMALPQTTTIDLDPIDDFEPLGLESAELGAVSLVPLPQAKELVPSNLVDLIDNQPEDVAQMLRGWLSDRRP
jgi:flagellar biosynthesis/type III secretory pathway M-ring protein FliF/YscJ